ncbi:hypothetical protein [Candidatus Cetobacterium colombiensis]|uniref:Type II secretion system protein n=1 Tax=Candidatus Cetobacterium colombiensis TaxID=3073100 RepID=A0ABU4WC59_9FUSO|nr:hypothetical protein [Candidatus Cetobacterium colombiensis]MDX8336740.1 hypothetical protein [Candidatus Cetobacterium colombiensis]
MESRKNGITYIETLIALTIFLIVLNPLFFSLIFIKRNFNNLTEYNLLENEMEKIRGAYKNNFTLETEYEVKIDKVLIYENLCSIEIMLQKNNIKRESKLYVYKQK